MPKTKFDQLTCLVQREATWVEGGDFPWKGDAILSSWFLQKLTLLASYAPQTEINFLLKMIEDRSQT